MHQHPNSHTRAAVRLHWLSAGHIDSPAGGYHLAFFDLFEVPKLIARDKGLEKTVVWLHEMLAYGLLVLHVGAALRHHFVLRDGMFRRMVP